jgi:hypothetical protein
VVRQNREVIEFEKNLEEAFQKVPQLLMQVQPSILKSYEDSLLDFLNKITSKAHSHGLEPKKFAVYIDLLHGWRGKVASGAKGSFEAVYASIKHPMFIEKKMSTLLTIWIFASAKQCMPRFVKAMDLFLNECAIPIIW